MKDSYHVIYVPETVWKKSAALKGKQFEIWKMEGICLTEEEVKEIKANNGNVRGYKSENDPMYAFYGNIVQMEHIRNGISTGIWGSVIIVLIKNTLMKRKFCLSENKNKG